MDIKKLAQDQLDYAIKHRRHLHAYPELTGKEFETLKYLTAELDALGIPYVEVPEGGILGFIDGPKPGKRVLLRADCDALPIDEPENNLKGPRLCRSNTPGVMHACGHDSHMAMLLAAGKILNENKDELEGSVLLCFERGEEGGGNIRYLLEYMEKEGIVYDSAFGMHVEQKMPAGTIAILDGGVNAASVPINIKITGRGGHGSRPDLSNNPIDCMMAIMNGLYNIRMKYISPFEQVTVSICQVQSGTAGNIIPGEAIIRGSARCFSTEGAIKPFTDAMDQICKGAGEMYGCDVEVNKAARPPLPVVNNPDCSELARQAMAKHWGEDVFSFCMPAMGSESFSLYGQFAPAVFANLGVANEEVGSGAELHNALFDLDESCMPVGIAAHVSYAIEFLRSDAKIDYEKPINSCKDLWPD